MEMINVEFNVGVQDYMDFIQTLTQHLSSLDINGDPILFHGIPVLRSQDEAFDQFNNQLTVTLITSNRRVTIWVDMRNLYLIVYSRNVDGIFLVFSDFFRAMERRVPGLRSLDYDSSYHGLGGASGLSRGALKLGQPQLQAAIFELAKFDNPNLYQHQARAKSAKSLLVIVQMIMEATRFKNIADRINQNWSNGVKLSDSMINRQNRWLYLSKLVKRLGRNISFDDADHVIIEKARNPDLQKPPIQLTVDYVQDIRVLAIVFNPREEEEQDL